MLDRGDVFAGYRIEGTLGRGGMGAVYLARHPAMAGPVALKLLNSDVSADPETRARFADEAEVVAHLHHPGIVAVYDSGVEDDRLWMAMQYVDGRDATVVSPRSLPADRVIALAGTTASALDYAHHAGVLHRDVKPANILLARPTRTHPEAALLTDFGIARLHADSPLPTRPGTILATLAYAAPEQLRGLPLDHRSDQYSLACTLFRMLTGALPHAATNPAAMIKGHLHDPPQPVAALRPDLPSTLDQVMTRALAKHPTDRYPTCTDFVDAVRDAFTTPTTQPLTHPATGHHPPAEQPLRTAWDSPGPSEDLTTGDDSPTTAIPPIIEQSDPAPLEDSRPAATRAPEKSQPETEAPATADPLDPVTPQPLSPTTSSPPREWPKMPEPAPESLDEPPTTELAIVVEEPQPAGPPQPVAAPPQPAPRSVEAFLSRGLYPTARFGVNRRPPVQAGALSGRLADESPLTESPPTEGSPVPDECSAAGHFAEEPSPQVSESSLLSDRFESDEALALGESWAVQVPPSLPSGTALLVERKPVAVRATRTETALNIVLGEGIASHRAPAHRRPVSPHRARLGYYAMLLAALLLALIVTFG
ncbi:protein kinase [Nocardia sp. NPDC050712]|uniref:protein kinase domain-containing protein n=1 Tax=Nocardia sp. NPDC050712 TaxID=3155518 RepID=UPI0033E48C59